jgi:hypothetical protein
MEHLSRFVKSDCARLRWPCDVRPATESEGSLLRAIPRTTVPPDHGVFAPSADTCARPPAATAKANGLTRATGHKPHARFTSLSVNSVASRLVATRLGHSLPRR